MATSIGQVSDTFPAYLPVDIGVAFATEADTVTAYDNVTAYNALSTA